MSAAVTAAQAPLIEVRASPLHGLGVFAARRCRGSFADAHTVEIDDGGGRLCRASADKIVIATGTRPARPASVEFDERTVIDAIFACRCGVEGCRGSMLWPPPCAP